MSHPETVRVKHPQGYPVTINKSDFNPEVHVLFDQVEAPPVEAPPVEAPPVEAPPVEQTEDDVRSRLASLSVVELQEALLDATTLEQVDLAEHVENEREGGPRKGALRAIEDRRAELQAQQ